MYKTTSLKPHNWELGYARSTRGAPSVAVVGGQLRLVQGASQGIRLAAKGLAPKAN